MTAVDTHLLLRALVDELARCGLTHAVTSPGSRNTPIVEALVHEPRVRAWSHIDERCGGFFAVGAARASGAPVAITCTSGGAVANLLPAVVEASEAHLPLIVLTADRPAELRQIGAGQTIDQVKIFGGYTRFFAELDLYEASAERMRWVRSMACRAYVASLGPDAGPVHLNIPLREPLVIDGPLPEDPAGAGGRPEGRPWVSTHPQGPATPAGDMDVVPRTLVVAGAGPPGVATAVSDFCARNGFPLLADPLSGARRGAAAIAHYDLLLRDPQFTAGAGPALVLRFGDLPTSKPLRSWLAALGDVPQLTLGSERSWADPASVTAGTFAVDPVAWVTGATLVGRRDPDWLAGWRAADIRAAAAIESTLGTDLSEPALARLLATELPAESTLYVAASMPIRDVEEFFPVAARPPRLLANRGANGIDGTVSSAFGSAAVSDGPVVLLIGDVALAHDMGGLLAARRTGLKLTVVLINNDGGGIFNFLAIAAGHPAAFTEHVATPHGLDFRHAAALYGLHHTSPTDVGGFTAALHRALDAEAGTIIEVRTDRVENRRLHADIAQAASQALSSPGAE
jgi:2-succinyl-5-enolpyruvyl-6-hydroxy-3-cyclohexene-1-carboxylate synthase